MREKMWEDYLNFVDLVETGIKVVVNIIVVIFGILVSIIFSPLALVGWLYEKSHSSD